jgi:hypothetical protein
MLRVSDLTLQGANGGIALCLKAMLVAIVLEMQRSAIVSHLAAGLPPAIHLAPFRADRL